MSKFLIDVWDFTSSLGAYALQQLGVTDTKPQNQTHWSDLKLPGLNADLRLNWHVMPDVTALVSMDADAVSARCLLIGPGVLLQLPHLLTKVTQHNTGPVWVLTTPTAVMEKIFLRDSVFLNQKQVTWLQLPDSQPQTMWLILLEQISQVPIAQASLTSLERTTMSNLQASMVKALEMQGAMAVALVDYRSGMCLAKAGTGIDLDLAAAGNTEVVKAKLKTMETLGIRRSIEDILITLHNQYHLIRLVPNEPYLFLYLVLDKEKGNLALARYKLMDIERELKV